MRRYVLLSHKPKMADIDVNTDGEHYLARTVFEPEPQAIRTGLLDASGNDIYSIDESEPVGFVRWCLRSSI